MGYHLSCQSIARPESYGQAPQTLTSGNIYLWNLETDQYLHRIAEFKKLLAVEEKLRAERYYQQKDTERYIVTRAILRLLLARYHSSEPEKIKFTTNKNRKPQLFEGNGIYFNVSHSHQRIAIAISTQEIGVDLEFVKPDFDYMDIASYSFAQEELTWLNESQHPVDDFFCLWTRKEAFLKGTGSGLTDTMHEFSCLDKDNPLPAGILGINHNWDLNTMKIPGDYFLSIATAESAAPLENQLFLFDFSQAAL